MQSRPLDRPPESGALATPADRGPGAADSCRALRDLAPEQSGVLCPHARVVRARLADLGLVAGTEVTVIRRAPLGDPIEIEVRGYRLCLRAADLAGLCVRAS